MLEWRSNPPDSRDGHAKPKRQNLLSHRMGTPVGLSSKLVGLGGHHSPGGNGCPHGGLLPDRIRYINSRGNMHPTTMARQPLGRQLLTALATAPLTPQIRAISSKLFGGT